MVNMIDFIDLKAQQNRIKDKIDAGIQNVLAHGQYILGPEVTELEEKLALVLGLVMKLLLQVSLILQQPKQLHF